jgi:threonylcarbamoyladenosine tRNA methylthiotransferase MtaB
MPTVAFETIGCRLNQYETERIAAGLASWGFRRVAFGEPADLYIINTCTVTGRADASCRKSIARAGRRGGKTRVVAVGCMVSADKERMAEMRGVDLVVDNVEKKEILSILKSRFPELFKEDIDELFSDFRRRRGEKTFLADFFGHNRAWVKIGDGCNQNCSYCIVPTVRGRLTNRSPEEIAAEISNLSAVGYNEVVLTAAHVGQYQFGRIDSLGRLIEYLLDQTDIARLRLSSIEPQEIDDSLLTAMSRAGTRVCRHLHIPLQSGSDKILKLMRRPYSSRDYIQTLEMARSRIENITIGADIIVGFPGESNQDFEKTSSIAELLDYLHVFSFSPRKGTAAAQFPERVDSSTIKDRNKALRGISDRKYKEALRRQIGLAAEVISERRPEKGSRFLGITDNYLRAAIPYESGGGKRIIRLRIIDSTDKYLIGEQGA